MFKPRNRLKDGLRTNISLNVFPSDKPDSQSVTHAGEYQHGSFMGHTEGNEASGE